jgi:hypothetical protein
MTEEFHIGDRVEWIGEDLGDPHAPKNGERGWVVLIDRQDDYVYRDEAGPSTGDWTRMPQVRRVGDRNEPDPAKWLPYDPHGRPQERHMSSFTRRLLLVPRDRSSCWDPLVSVRAIAELEPYALLIAGLRLGRTATRAPLG